MVEEHLWLLDCSYANKHSHDLDYPPLGALEMMIIYKINFNFYSVRPENSNWVHAVIKKTFLFATGGVALCWHYKTMQASDGSLMLTAISKM